MISPARLAANRANSLLSTGPRTPAGKRRSSRNAVTHGLTSQTVVISASQREYYAKLHHAFAAELQPVGVLEQQVLCHLVNLQWRLSSITARVFSIDTRAANSTLAGISKTVVALANISLYEQRLTRSFLIQFKFFRTLKMRRDQCTQASGGFDFTSSKYPATPVPARAAVRSQRIMLDFHLAELKSNGGRPCFRHDSRTPVRQQRSGRPRGEIGSRTEILAEEIDELKVTPEPPKRRIDFHIEDK